MTSMTSVCLNVLGLGLLWLSEQRSFWLVYTAFFVGGVAAIAAVL